MLICFDHLYSEYLTLKSLIDDETIARIEKLREKVEQEDAAIGENPLPIKKGQASGESLSWDELYYFELILANHTPVEKLRSKIIRLRSDYQSIASAKQYAEYLASKPPDLQSPPEPTDPPHGTKSDFEILLREDLKDLLGRVYLKYEILPVREKRITDLTMFAAKLCAISLLLLLSILLIVFVVPLYYDIRDDVSIKNALETFTNSATLSSLTVFVVVVSGAMGGFVSALQRIQSPPTEGDSVYNLSLLFHGSKSVFVAPITGAIFAILLYLMFTAGVVKGSFFPQSSPRTGRVRRSRRTAINLDKIPIATAKGMAMPTAMGMGMGMGMGILRAIVIITATPTRTIPRVIQALDPMSQAIAQRPI